MNIERHLRNEIARETVIGTFKKCRIKDDISNLKYHRLNWGSVEQEKMTLKLWKLTRHKKWLWSFCLKNWMLLLNTRQEIVLLWVTNLKGYIVILKPRTFIVIQQNTHYDRRLINIKVKISNTDMKGWRKRRNGKDKEGYNKSKQVGYGEYYELVFRKGNKMGKVIFKISSNFK